MAMRGSKTASGYRGIEMRLSELALFLEEIELASVRRCMGGQPLRPVVLTTQFQPAIRVGPVGGTVVFDRIQILITANPVHGHCPLDEAQ